MAIKMPLNPMLTKNQLTFTAILTSVLYLVSAPIFAASGSDQLSMMERIVQGNLGRDVNFEFHPKMFGMTGVQLDNFRIAENPDYLESHPYLSPWAMHAEKVEVRYNPLAFFIGRISLSKVDVQNPQVQISVDSRFKHNFEDILNKQKSNRFSNWIRAHHINIDNMHWNIFSELLFAQPVKYEIEDIDVNIQNVIKGKVADIDIRAKTPGAAKQNVDIHGTIGPILTIGRIEESPMDIDLKVKNAPLDFELANVPEEIFKDRRYRRTLALPESGVANVHYSLDGDVWEKLEVKGDISLKNIVMASIDKSIKGKSFFIDIKSNSNISLNEQTTHLENISININDSTLSLNGTVEQIIDNPQADLSLSSNNINLAEFNRIYPFISDIYKIKFIKGTTDIQMTAGGNLQDGLMLNGDFHTRDLQLSNLNESRLGETLNSSITLEKPIWFFADKNLAQFDKIALRIANSEINIKGIIEDATLIDRKLKANISSDSLDVSAMHRFAPFYDAYLPDELKYSGFFSFNADIEGNVFDGFLKGNADFSRFNFSIKNFIRKTQKSLFNIDFHASYNEEEELKSGASFILEQGALDNSVIYTQTIKFLLGGSKMNTNAKQYFSNVKTQSTSFKKSSGQFQLNNFNFAEVDLVVKGIQSHKQQDASLNLSGKIGIEDFDLTLDGELVLNEKDAAPILQLNPEAKRYWDNKGQYLKLPIKVTGTINQPKLQLP